MEILIISGLILISYFALNIYVRHKINKASYVNEERKSLHKKFIWILPFIGPLIIKGYWKDSGNESLDVMTKNRRKIRQGGSTNGNCETVVDLSE